MKKLPFLTFLLTVSIMAQLRTSSIVSNPISLTRSRTLFSDKPNSNGYWHALIELSKNNKDAALAHIAAAQKTDSNIPSLEFDPSDTIDTCFDKLFIQLISNDPLSLSYLGLFETIGIRDHNAHLSDLTLQSFINDLEAKKRCLHALKSYESANLTRDQYISYKIIRWMFEHAVEAESFLFHEYKVNQMFGLLSDLSSTFTRFHRLELPEDGQRYISRLQKVPQYIDETIALLEHQKSCNIILPTFAMEKVIKSIQKTIPAQVTECFLYAHLATECKAIPECDHASLLSSAHTAIQTHVYPAYQKLLAYCQKLHADSSNVHGVWALPNGDAFYEHCLARHTTTRLTADEIHELGLREVAIIQKEMREIFAREGIINVDKTVGQLMQDLSKDPRFYFPATAQGRAQCIAEYEAILARCRKELYPLFDIKPEIPVKVEPVPQHEEEGQPGAYYMSPSMDGKRPGTFYANLRNLAEMPTYGMETLAVHEAEPGHHFQRTLEQQQMNVPIMRKLGEFTAYVEGWALYAEKLAYEHNFYSSSYAQLGHLQDELLRAVRLVVDTGIHKKRWTREQAIEYMVQNTGYYLSNIITEVERYFVMPGQACAYKIGQLKILELRKRAKDVLKQKFDIREFHNVVLTLGAAPLTVLEEAVDAYIAQKL